jgi:hypothetical protein
MALLTQSLKPILDQQPVGYQHPVDSTHGWTSSQGMNTVNSISQMGSGFLGRIWGSGWALVTYVVKDMLINPVYAIIEAASPIKGITSSLNKVVDLTIWDIMSPASATEKAV